MDSSVDITEFRVRFIEKKIMIENEKSGQKVVKKGHWPHGLAT